MNIMKPALVNACATVLGDTVVLSYKVAGAHWNITGPKFPQYHVFFQEIYQNINESIDSIAESLRALGSKSPSKLSDFISLSRIPEYDGKLLISDIFDSNEIIIFDLDEAFSIANNSNEQGIANLIAERLHFHKKIRWQLAACLEEE